ncbi:cytochrome p450 [Rhyzopertha dominica]|nr:cytochrome p450 [Rhyzopertha dominica]
MAFILYTIGLLGVFALAFSAYIKWIQSYWKRKGIPNFEAKFPFGNTENPFTRPVPFTLEIKDLYLEMKRRNYKYGGITSLTRSSFIPVDLDVIRSILTKNFNSFSERGLFHNDEVEPLDGHLFNISGKKWRDLRVRLTPTFTSGKMKMMFNTLVDCGQPMIKAMQYYADEGKAVDIKEMLACFTTDVIGSCAFGLECNSFKENDSEFRKYGRKVFTVNLRKMAKIMFAFSFPNLAKKLSISLTDDDVSAFFMKAVKDTVEYRQTSRFTRNDFLQLLVNMWDSDGSGNGFNMDEIAAQAFVFFIAGFETSSTAMTFSLYELAVNQDVQTKLREDINKILDRHDGVVSYESIQDMKYLNQVLDESLRKYPPLAILNRDCTRDCFIEEAGVTVEKGLKVIIPVLGLHHDPDYFPDPEKFDPDRFSDENKGNIPAYAYLPFGDGPRNCIGARFGQMQSKVGLALLIKNFQFTLSDKTITPLQMDPFSFILTTKGGMWLNVKRVQ